jgi:ribosomal protein S18 acetylase RimI-like enzyme
VLLRLTGSTGISHLATREGTAEIEDLYVTEVERGRGFGSALLRRAEEEAEAGGAAGLGFAVEVENVGARRFYARHGYRETSDRPFTLKHTVTGDDGIVRYGVLRCTYFVKHLGA